MRYIKDSVVINPHRDLPLLRQVRNSRFVTHQQLFEFMQLVETDERRNSFNWRTKRLLRSGHLSICDGRFGTGAAIYRITKSGLDEYDLIAFAARPGALSTSMRVAHA